jgi:hypothetical protein
MADTTYTITVSPDGDANQLRTPRNRRSALSACQDHPSATDDDEETEGARALLAHWGLS